MTQSLPYRKVADVGVADVERRYVLQEQQVFSVVILELTRMQSIKGHIIAFRLAALLL